MLAFFIFNKFKENQCVFYPKYHCQPMKTFETNNVAHTHTHEGLMIMTIYLIIWLKFLLYIYIYIYNLKLGDDLSSYLVNMN